MHQQFVLKCRAEELPSFRSKIRGMLLAGGWNEKQTGEWTLVLDEALTNVMRHAYPDACGEIKIEYTDSEDRTEFVIEDRGMRFDPTQLPEPKLPKETPGGLGVHLIRCLTDTFEYDSSFKEGNRIKLIRNKTEAKRSRA